MSIIFVILAVNIISVLMIVSLQKKHTNNICDVFDASKAWRTKYNKNNFK